MTIVLNSLVSGDESKVFNDSVQCFLRVISVDKGLRGMQSGCLKHTS